MELKIVGWTYFESDYPTIEMGDNIGEIVGVVQQEIADKGYLFAGEQHQNSLTGVPVFNNGTCFRASMRAWGSLMAMIYTGPNGEELSYMDFYMSLSDAVTRMPEFEDFDVEPADLESGSGCIIQADHEMIQQSIDMDMMFMTTDKVLLDIMDKIKANK
jgi:hypothetical protein